MCTLCIYVCARKLQFSICAQSAGKGVLGNRKKYASCQLHELNYSGSINIRSPIFFPYDLIVWTPIVSLLFCLVLTNSMKYNIYMYALMIVCQVYVDVCDNQRLILRVTYGKKVVRLFIIVKKLLLPIPINNQHGGTWLCFKQYELVHNKSLNFVVF